MTDTTSPQTDAGRHGSRLGQIAFVVAALVGTGSAAALWMGQRAPADTASTAAVPAAGMTPSTADGSGTTAAASAASPAPTGPASGGVSAIDARAATAAAPASPGPDAAAMVAKLEARLREQPEDREGWTMLARAYAVMGRDQEAVDVHRRLLALSPPDARSRAQAHADLGRALGKAGGRKLTPEADAELRRALALDPANVMAHALLGRVALERGDAASASRHWRQALEGVDQGHPFAQQLRDSITVADEAASATAGVAPSTRTARP